MFSDCHICNSHNTELMPISSGESFRIEYSQTKGMEMEFYRGNNIVDRQQFANEYEAHVHYRSNTKYYL